MTMHDRLPSMALREAEEHPLIMFFIRCFAKRIREQAELPTPSQSWQERITCAFAHSVLDFSQRLLEEEEAESSLSP
jgi:hypothetical protein